MDDKTKAIIGAGAAPQTQVRITPEIIRVSKNVTCECGGMLFSEKIFFKILSGLVSQSGKEEMIPMPVFVCEKCGKVPQFFDSQNVLPDAIKTTPVNRGEVEVNGNKQVPFTVSKNE
jgi:hypothetical protein